MNIRSHFSFPIVSVPFAGGYYMCVEGSPRHEALNRANHAFNMGDRHLAEELKLEALGKYGCAFEAREEDQEQSHDLKHYADNCLEYADVCFETLLANKKNN